MIQYPIALLLCLYTKAATLLKIVAVLFPWSIYTASYPWGMTFFSKLVAFSKFQIYNNKLQGYLV